MFHSSRYSRFYFILKKVVTFSQNKRWNAYFINDHMYEYLVENDIKHIILYFKKLIIP